MHVVCAKIGLDAAIRASARNVRMSMARTSYIDAGMRSIRPGQFTQP